MGHFLDSSLSVKFKVQMRCEAAPSFIRTENDEEEELL